MNRTPVWERDEGRFDEGQAADRRDWDRTLALVVFRRSGWFQRGIGTIPNAARSTTKGTTEELRSRTATSGGLGCYRSGIALVHTPVHASWLNQVEIYFSIIQRKVLTPNDFVSLAVVEERLRLSEALSNRHPRPFAWKFDRQKLTEFLQRLEAKRVVQGQAQAG